MCLMRGPSAAVQLTIPVSKVQQVSLCSLGDSPTNGNPMHEAVLLYIVC